MKKISRRKFLQFGALGAAAVLAGCAQPAPTPTTAPAAPATSAAPAATKAPTAAVAAASPTPGRPTTSAGTKPAGLLTVVLRGENPTIDPTIAIGNEPPKNWIRNVAEPLIDRVKNSTELKPRLAEKWERIEPTVWRFYLRKGVKFSDGTPFTSEAVVWSLKREIDPAVASMSLAYISTVADVKAIDDYTVDIVTKNPDPVVPIRMWYAPIVKPADAQTLAVSPVGTGPYKVVEWAKGQYLKWTAFEDYWGGAPKIKDVTFVFRNESRVRASMVKTGEADFADQLSPEDAQVVPVTTTPSLSIAFLRFNTFNPVLKDLRVRQALVYAIDYDSILNKLYGGFASPANGAEVVTPLVLGFNPNVKQFPYDLEKAKQLVKDAGAQGAKLTVWTLTGMFPRNAELGEFLVESWRSIGLDVSLQFVDDAGWNQKFYAVKPEQNPADIVLGRHENDTYDSLKSAEGYIVCNGRYSLVCDQALTDLVTKAGAAEGDERARLYQQAWAKAQEIIPWVGLVNFSYVWAWSDRLQWSNPPIDGKIDLREMSLK